MDYSLNFFNFSNLNKKLRFYCEDTVHEYEKVDIKDKGNLWYSERDQRKAINSITNEIRVLSVLHSVTMIEARKMLYDNYNNLNQC